MTGGTTHLLRKEIGNLTYSTALCLLASVLISAPAVAAAAECAALDQLYRDARTNFPALEGKRFEGAVCAYGSHKYQCAWSFSTDRYADAETQVDRLSRCTAAEPGATPLKAKHGEQAFRINPETSVAIRGPDADDGSWKIRLKVETSADWD
jgi:hypothetical protein